jgi:hypothetical protein
VFLSGVVIIAIQFFLITLRPEASARWFATAPYVRIVYALVIFLPFLSLPAGEFVGVFSLDYGTRAYLSRLRVIAWVQIILITLQISVSTYGLMWLVGFGQLADKVSVLLKWSPTATRAVSYLLQVAIAGIIGNFAYDILKKMMTSTEPTILNADKTPK